MIYYVVGKVRIEITGEMRVTCLDKPIRWLQPWRQISLVLPEDKRPITEAVSGMARNSQRE